MYCTEVTPICGSSDRLLKKKVNYSFHIDLETKTSLSNNIVLLCTAVVQGHYTTCQNTKNKRKLVLYLLFFERERELAIFSSFAMRGDFPPHSYFAF